MSAKNPVSRPINVLYVDDEPSLLELGKIFLERSNDIKVDLCSDSLKALKFIESNNFDVIVSDYQMPDMDGIQLLKALRGTGNRVPFIIFTGKGREDVVIEALNNGADFYLQKGGKPGAQFAELENLVRHLAFRNSLETQIHSSEVRYRALFEEAADAILLMDKELFLDCNLAAERLFKCSRKEIVRLGPKDLSPLRQVDGRPSAISAAEYVSRAFEGESLTFDWVHQDAQGKPFFAEVSLRRVDIEGQPLLHSIVRDKTEQRRLERLLRESESRFRNLAEMFPLGIVLLDTDGNNRYCNMEAMRLLGVDNGQEVTAGLFISRFSLDDAQISLGASEDEKEVLVNLRQGAEERNYRLIVSYRLQEGGVPGTQIIIEDVTERQRIQRELELKTEEMRTILDSAPAMISYIGSDMRVRYSNIDVSTGSGEGPVGRTCHEFWRQDVDKCADCPVKQSFKTGETHEGKVETGDGRTFFVKSRPIRAPDGAVNGVLEIRQDITDLLEKEQRLRESEDRYQRLTENAVDLIYRLELSPVRRFSYVSPSALDITGFTPEDHYDDPDLGFKLIHPDDRPMLMGLMQDTEQISRPITLRWVRKDGQIIWTEQRNVPVYDGQGNLVALEGIARDVTERKLLQKALEESNKKMQLLSSITRHDLLNSLMLLQGYFDLLMGSIGNQGGMAPLRMSEAIDRLKRIISFTSQYEELGTEGAEWQRLEALVDGNCLGDIPVEVRCRGYEVLADRMLEKVLFNLAENTRRHSGAKMAWLECQERDGELIVSWNDDGRGISLEQKSRVFERGFGSNTGFGLFLCREILAITGIRIRENGVPGQGARFEMHVPAGYHRRIQDDSSVGCDTKRI